MVDRLLVAEIQLLRGSLEGQLRAESAAARTSQVPQLPWRPGERLSASVDILRGSERAILRIGSFAFDALVPPGAYPGQKLELVFISASPRVTFGLVPSAPGQPDSDTLDPGKHVDISRAARRLDSIFAALARSPEQDDEATKEVKPLVQGFPADAKALATALQERVSRSGMFYESHLEHWAEGRLPLERIRQEPQGQLAVPARSGTSEEASDRLPRPSQLNAHNVVAQPAAGEDETDAVHPATVPQVRAQLEALQSGQIAWQGQVWSGQDMRIEIEEEPQSGAEPDGARPWTSRLRLELPRLGCVDVVMQLSGQQLRVRISAADADSAAELRDWQPRLLAQLEDARLSLVEFDVGAAAA